MPFHVALDDDEILFRVEPFADAVNGLGGNVPFDFLAFPVVVVQQVGVFLGFDTVIGQEKVQRATRVFHSTGSVERGPR